MNIPLIDLRAQYLEVKSELDEALRRVLDSGIYIGGPEVEALEREIAAFIGVRYAISVANGTDALTLALEAAGIGPGDEVITTSFTFFATAEAIVRQGAVPVFADIDPRTFNISPEAVAAKVTPRTKAILPVHIFGQPADMDALQAIAEQYNLLIIEDACQAIGSTYKGRAIGSIGDIGCISFFPTKNLGGYGDGGIVVTNNEGVADRIRLLCHHGSRRKYIHEIAGYNSRLDPLQAAALRVKLAKLREWNDRRRDAAAYYNEHLQELPLVLPYASGDNSHVYHLYVTLYKERERLTLELKRHGISTGHYYPCPQHLQQALRHLGYRRGDLPVTEAVCEQSFALPISPHLTREQQQYIIDKLKRYAKG